VQLTANVAPTATSATASASRRRTITLPRLGLDASGAHAQIASRHALDSAR
jgi:hypothetical protein